MKSAKPTISAEGRAAAEAELRLLVEQRRPEIVAAIKVAREFGDLKENAEYHAAREAQSMNEARIRVLEHHLATAIVEEPASGDVVGVGSKVSFRDGDGGEDQVMTVVHPLEASLADGKLSVESPIGQALVGGRKGDRVEVETRRGAKLLEILEVG